MEEPKMKKIKTVWVHGEERIVVIRRPSVDFGRSDVIIISGDTDAPIEQRKNINHGIQVTDGEIKNILRRELNLNLK